jgi:hypothetical protein
MTSARSGITVSQDDDQQTDFAILESFTWKTDPDADNDGKAGLSPPGAARIRTAIERARSQGCHLPCEIG